MSFHPTVYPTLFVIRKIATLWVTGTKKCKRYVKFVQLKGILIKVSKNSFEQKRYEFRLKNRFGMAEITCFSSD